MKPSRILVVLLAAAMGAASGIALARSGALAYFNFSHKPFLPAWIVVSEGLVLWAVISTHEAGHLLAAAAVGFRGLLYVSGPLYFHRDDRGWRLRLNRNFALYGGIVSALPLSMRRLREKLFVMVAAGPAASVASGALALAFVSSTPPASLVRAVLASYALVSLTIGAITLFPARTVGYLTDGGQLIRLIRGGLAVERDNALLLLLAASFGGTRPRDWDRPALDVVTRRSDDPRERATAARVAFTYALDLGDLDAARRHLGVVLADVQQLPRPIQAMVLVNAAYFAARHDADPVTARARLAQAGKAWKLSPGATSIADAAIAFSEGRSEQIAPLLAAAEAAIAHSIDLGATTVARDLIEELRALSARTPIAIV